MSDEPTEPSRADHLERIAHTGYTIVPDVLSVEACDEFIEALQRLERELDVRPAGNSFEGARTTRVYNLLARGLLWQLIATHDEILPIVEGVLDRGCLVSSLSSVSIGPGEVVQPIHADDQMIPLPKPHPATVCNSMWALTDFTERNGATRVVPGSHLAASSPNYGAPYDSIPAEMNRGSVLVWHGSLWHGGGANTTDETRIGIAMNYCAGWIRAQENQQLGLSPTLVASFSPRLRELVGYGVYNGLIGHIDRRDPASVFFEGSDQPMLWDQT